MPPDYASACGASCTACAATGTFDRPICSTGTCGTACITSCGAACVDVNRDNANCGSCGVTCSGGQLCTTGECRLACATGQAFDGALPYVKVSPNSGYKLLVEDLNADGRVDLVDNGSGVGLHVRYANADGTYQAPVLINTSSSQVNAFVLVDVNADGRKDLVATRGSTAIPNVFVSLNTGSGFAAATGLGMSGYLPSGVVLASDINNDGKPDLIVPASSTYFFYFVQTATAGVFPATYSHWSTNTMTNPIYGEVADFNKDTRPDIVVGTATQYQVLITNSAALPASGASTVFLPQTAVPLASIGGIRAADINGDTNPDVLVRTGTAGYYSLGTGTGAFNAGTALPFAGNSAIVPVDLNADGIVDLVSGGSSAVYLALATAQGTWPTTVARLLNAPPTLQTVIGVGQLIGSAPPEIFTATQSASSVQVSILVNDGAGLFPGAKVTGSGTTSATAAAGDIDGNGARDLVIGPTIGTNGTGTGSVLLGNNSGTFGAVASTVNLRGDELAMGRLNGDAFVDLVASIESTTIPGVDVFLGTAGGTLAAPTRLATTSLPTRVLIANLDADAIADVIVGTAAGVEWFHGNGDGTFGTAQIVAGAQGAVQAVAVADLNLDGKMDLLINNGTGSLRVYPAYGSGFALNAFTTMTTSATATDVVSVDFDRDGRPDVAVATATGVLLYRGTGNGGLTAQPGQPTMLGRLNVVDLDNDGFFDLVSNNGDVQVARGQANFVFQPRQPYVPGRTLSAQVVLVDKFNGDTFRDVVVLTTSTEIWTYLGMCR